MSKEEKILRYYVLCNKLKNVIRTGWKDWNVKKERLESVAEHVYGVQMLAIAMKSEYQYDVDIARVVMMLAVHELEEILIGDLTPFQITKEEKSKIGNEAVEKILDGLIDKKQIMDMTLEFDARESKEAKFAYFCDKLEADLQCRLYDEERCVDINNQDNNNTMNDPKVKELLDGGMSWSEMWLAFSRDKNNYDEHFTTVSNYASENNISHIIKQRNK